MQKTHVAIALDRSGSMDGIRKQTVDAYNAMIDRVKLLKDENNDVRVSLWTFGSDTKRQYVNCAVESIAKLSYNEYTPSGYTRLYGTVEDIVTTLNGMPDASECSFLVLVVTDGEDTSNTSPNGMRKAIDSTISSGRWSFGFQVPNEYVAGFSRISGLSKDNIFPWSSDTKGIAAASAANVQAIDGYVAARRSGAKSVGSLYVTASLANVDKSQIKKDLVDLSKTHKIHTADRDSVTRVLAEYLTGRDYVTGSVYYQLIKTEEVQAHKEVLIVEKGTKIPYGGPAARNMIGLSSSGTVKVVPGNLSNYDVFVQSKAPNRKIPRGTKVIINCAKATPDTPTWENN